MLCRKLSWDCYMVDAMEMLNMKYSKSCAALLKKRLNSTKKMQSRYPQPTSGKDYANTMQHVA